MPYSLADLSPAQVDDADVSLWTSDVSAARVSTDESERFPPAVQPLILGSLTNASEKPSVPAQSRLHVLQRCRLVLFGEEPRSSFKVALLMLGSISEYTGSILQGASFHRLGTGPLLSFDRQKVLILDESILISLPHLFAFRRVGRSQRVPFLREIVSPVD